VLPPHPGIGKEKHREASYADKNTKRAQKHPDSYQHQQVGSFHGSPPCMMLILELACQLVNRD